MGQSATRQEKRTKELDEVDGLAAGNGGRQRGIGGLVRHVQGKVDIRTTP